MAAEISRLLKNTRAPNQSIIDNICLYKFIPFKEENKGTANKI